MNKGRAGKPGNRRIIDLHRENVCFVIDFIAIEEAFIHNIFFNLFL